MTPSPFLDRDELIARLRRARIPPEEFIRVVATLGRIARMEGLLALEDLLGEIAEPDFRMLLGLVVSGTEPDHVRWECDRIRINRGENAYGELLPVAIVGLQSGDSCKNLIQALYSAIGGDPPWWPEGAAHRLISEAMACQLSADGAGPDEIGPWDELSRVVDHISAQDLTVVLGELDFREMVSGFHGSPRRVREAVFRRWNDAEARLYCIEVPPPWPAPSIRDRWDSHDRMLRVVFNLEQIGEIGETGAPPWYGWDWNSAMMANEECEKQFGETPFFPRHASSEIRDGRIHWGSRTNFTADGFAAEVSFDENFRDVRVEIFRIPGSIR